MAPFLFHFSTMLGEDPKQTALHFDVAAAADLEQQLILAHAQQAPFEQIYDIMLRLYQTVFCRPAQHFQRAALLRTFLYLYKSSLEAQGPLREEDQTLLLALAKASAQELNAQLI